MIESKKTRKFSHAELEQMFHHYKRLVDELPARRDFDAWFSENYDDLVQTASACTQTPTT